jgi:hypothetical protein
MLPVPTFNGSSIQLKSANKTLLGTPCSHTAQVLQLQPGIVNLPVCPPHTMHFYNHISTTNGAVMVLLAVEPETAIERKHRNRWRHKPDLQILSLVRYNTDIPYSGASYDFTYSLCLLSITLINYVRIRWIIYSRPLNNAGNKSYIKVEILYGLYRQ